MSSGTVLVVLAVAACVALLLFGRRDKARRIGLDDPSPTARKRMEAAGTRLTPADHAEVARLVSAGRKMEAIKLVRAATGLGMKESKEFVEHTDFSQPPAPARPAPDQSRAAEEQPVRSSGPWAEAGTSAPTPGPGLSSLDLVEVARALAAGRKIEAIKMVREKTGMGLKEAKDFVEGPAFDDKR